jgi:hypothetical protein
MHGIIPDLFQYYVFAESNIVLILQSLKCNFPQ